MKRQLMYQDDARYYDLIYSWKNYEKEVAKVERLISKYKKSKGKKLLDVGCGTGQHIRWFKKNYSCTGVDINNGMLEEARKNCSSVKFIRQDMQHLDTKEKYDVITCLFSSIGYLKTEKEIAATMNHFAEHLAPGGVVLVEPWFTPDAYFAGSPHMKVYDKKDIKIARLVVSKIIGELSIMDMHWLIAEKNKEVQYFVDRHECRLTKIDDLVNMMKKTGLKTIFLKRGISDRGTLVGIKV